MKKFQTITSILVMALALSSVGMAKQKPAAQKATPKGAQATHTAKQKLLTVRGEVSAVDVSSNTLTLKVGTKTETFVFDNKTQMIESGKAIQPSAITTGMRATVRYMERDGRNWASHVTLHPVRTGKAKPPRKM